MVGGTIEDMFPNMLETPLDQKSTYMDIVSFRIKDYMDHYPSDTIMSALRPYTDKLKTAALVPLCGAALKEYVDPFTGSGRKNRPL